MLQCQVGYHTEGTEINHWQCSARQLTDGNKKKLKCAGDHVRDGGRGGGIDIKIRKELKTHFIKKLPRLYNLVICLFVLRTCNAVYGRGKEG